MRTIACIIAILLPLSLMGGCPAASDVIDVAGRLTGAVGVIQTRPPELPPTLIDRGDTIIIDNSVTIIVDPVTDIEIINLPNRTVLGFENDTGWDIYIEYFADDIFQSVYVYDGEALLLEYPCLTDIELITEEDIDPFTGEVVDWFDLSGTFFFNPDDFLCGDAFILTFDPFAIEARAEAVRLIP